MINFKIGEEISHDLSEQILLSHVTDNHLRLAESLLANISADMGIDTPTDEQIGVAAKIISSMQNGQAETVEPEHIDSHWLLNEAARLAGQSSGRIHRLVLAVNYDLEDLDEGLLPVDRFKDEIIETIRDNRISIITAETGAGKSSQVPQYLLEEGYRVIVTQPRRMAARSLASWVASQREDDQRGTVAYRTAFERNDNRDTRLLYCTDGLQMIRELAGDGAPEGTVLVLDEIHEWNINMEVLIAWVKKQIKEGKNIKVVLMSATLDANNLAEYFKGKDGSNVPQLEIPGRLFPVTENEVGERQMIETIATLARRGRNVLVFQPGKKEISKTIAELEKANLDAEIIPLHGQLEPRDQEKVFKRYGHPKIVVSTNVAQTSVTIEDIDAVVDSGEERRVELDDEIEKLSLRPISQADCKQRKGRAGRCRPGEYYLCSRTSFEQRDEFPVPEIQRVRLDQMVLRLAAFGMDATEIDFYHQPDIGALKQAREALVAIGALRSDGSVTELGEEISRLPIDVHLGRMVLEARKHNCVDEVLTIAACIEAGGIRDKSELWRRLTEETHSDVLAELDIFRKAQEMKPDQMKANGVIVKAYFRALEIRRHLIDGLDRAKFTIDKSDTVDREAIMRSVVSGMVDKLYENAWGNNYRRNDDMRFKGRQSVVMGNPKWLVGIPLDIEGKDRYGWVKKTSLLTMCSWVDLEWLFDVAPQLVENQVSEPYYNIGLEGVGIDEITLFNGSEVRRVNKEAPINTETVAIFCKVLITGQIRSGAASSIYRHNQRIIRLLQSENLASDKEIRDIENENLADMIDCLIGLEINNNHEFERAIQAGRISASDLAIQPDNFLSGKKLAKVNSELEQQAREISLVEFLRKNPPQRLEIDAMRTLPSLPNPQIYDYESGDKVYPSLDFDRGVCMYVWVPSSSIAVKETNDALQKMIAVMLGRHITLANKTLTRLRTNNDDAADLEFFNDCQAKIENFSGLLVTGRPLNSSELDKIDVLIEDLEAYERGVIDRDYQDNILENGLESYADLVKRGHVLEHFEVTCERKLHTKCGEAFVIEPNGVLRAPDQECSYRRGGDARVYWRAVAVDELAICWTDENGFETAKKPMGGLTDSQLKTVAQLEDERYISRGTFGVDREDDQISTLQKLIAISLDEMEDEDILEQHELVSQMIEKIISEDPDIDIIFDEMENVTQRLNELASDIERGLNERDLATGNRAKRLKAKVKTMQNERKELQMRLSELKPRSIEQEEARDLLNTLRRREREIDQYFS